MDLVAGPMSVAPLLGVLTQSVESTEDMAEAIKRLLPEVDVLVMAAAPADFRPARPESRKIKKSAKASPLELEATPDVLLSTAGPSDLPERQQTMNATVAWSYQLLDGDEQRAFRLHQ